MARQIKYRGFILRAEAEKVNMFAWTSTVDVRPEGSLETSGKQYAPHPPRGLFASESEAEDAAIERGKSTVRSGDAAR